MKNPTIPNLPKKAIFYARVSSEGQVDNTSLVCFGFLRSKLDRLSRMNVAKNFPQIPQNAEFQISAPYLLASPSAAVKYHG